MPIPIDEPVTVPPVEAKTFDAVWLGGVRINWADPNRVGSAKVIKYAMNTEGTEVHYEDGQPKPVGTTSISNIAELLAVPAEESDVAEKIQAFQTALIEAVLSVEEYQASQIPEPEPEPEPEPPAGPEPEPEPEPGPPIEE